MVRSGGVTIVKRGGRRSSEDFNPDKLEKSVTAACLSSGASRGQSELYAKRVVKEVEEWLDDRPEVTSSDIRRIAGKHLQRYHHDAAYLYQQHRVTL